GLPWAASRHPRDGAVPHVRSVPTRRSSDLAWYFKGYAVGGELRAALAQSSSLAEIDELLGRLDHDQPYPGADAEGQRGRAGTPKDRKSTRLNSSHVKISYAVFCLKKNKSMQ